jgi:hypothetical protein
LTFLDEDPPPSLHRKGQPEDLQQKPTAASCRNPRLASPLLNGEAEVIVERSDAKHVSISLEWSGKNDLSLPKHELTAFVKDDTNQVLQMKSTSSIAGAFNDEVYLTESFTVELPGLRDLTAVRPRRGGGPSRKPFL